MASYRMKAVSHLTGIRPELLRMWERRYALFKPQRAGNRYREFDDEDVQLLRYLRQQIEQGRTIGELAAEGREALLHQITPSSAPKPVTATDPLIDDLLAHILQLDKSRLEARLAELAAFTSFASLLTSVLTPLMHHLGEAWASGKANVVSGHFATAIFKQRLFSLLQATASAAEAPLVICACPEGERHELGLLSLAYTLQQDGWQVLYLGPNLPTHALIDGCQQLQPDLLALSLTYTLDAARRLEIIHEIDTQVACRYPTLLGGQAIEADYQTLDVRHITICDSLATAIQQGHRIRQLKLPLSPALTTLSKSE